MRQLTYLALAGLILAASVSTRAERGGAAGELSEVSDLSGLSGLSWLTGSWARSGDGWSSEEHWTRPAGGMMLGMNRTVRGDRTIMWESVRIEATDDGIVYLAAPRGRSPATPFKLIEQHARRVVFENAAHDFPQRIIYERKGDRLHARIEGVEGDEPRQSAWSWDRTSLDAMTP